ncbi:hypothetical protein [Chryseobacterium wanjuense]
MYKIILGVLFSIAFSHVIYSQENENESISVDGKIISYQTFNIKNRQNNEPILVFEHGIGGGNFEQIFLFYLKIFRDFNTTGMVLVNRRQILQ